MPSLRKACRSCTAPKRKCVVQTPSCVRCIQKGIKCSYDLEHINAPIGTFERFPPLEYHSSTCVTPGYCVLKSLKFRGESIDPAVCVPGHNDNLVILRSIYFSIPDLMIADKPAVFIHPRLQLQSNYNHCSIFLGPMHDDMAYENLRDLAQVDFENMSAHEALSALQALILHTSTFLFSENPIYQETAEKCLAVLSTHTENLLHSAQTWKCGNQSL